MDYGLVVGFICLLAPPQIGFAFAKKVRIGTKQACLVWRDAAFLLCKVRK